MSDLCRKTLKLFDHALFREKYSKNKKTEKIIKLLNCNGIVIFANLEEKCVFFEFYRNFENHISKYIRKVDLQCVKRSVNS